MRLIIDANEVFSLFNKKSKVRELSLLPTVFLYSPKFALKEMTEHKKEITYRFGLSNLQFETIFDFLSVIVKFVDAEDYADVINEAKTISPDSDDVDYFALALKLECPIWSEDKKLKNQNKVIVYSTKDLLGFLNIGFVSGE